MANRRDRRDAANPIQDVVELEAAYDELGRVLEERMKELQGRKRPTWSGWDYSAEVKKKSKDFARRNVGNVRDQQPLF